MEPLYDFNYTDLLSNIDEGDNMTYLPSQNVILSEVSGIANITIPRYILCRESNFVSLPFCNGTSMYDYKYDYTESLNLEKIVSVIVPILFGIIIVVGLFGNSLVVITVVCNQQMRNTTNILIFNLALADILFIIFCIPFTAIDYALLYWPFGNAMCRVVQYLVMVTVYVSIYTLVFMSLDRFLAVVHPINSMSIRTEKNTFTVIILTWVVMLTVCSPALLAHGEHKFLFAYRIQTVCKFLDSQGWNHLAYQLSFFVTSYMLPLGIVSGLYVVMLKRLWGVAPGGHMSQESLRGKKRVTKMVIVVVVIFAVCWCPIQINLVLKSLNYYDPTPTLVMIQVVSHVLAYMNSCVNPILYAFLSDNFRKAFRKVVHCKSCSRAQTTRLDMDTRNLTSKLTTRFHNGQENVENEVIL